MMFLFYITWEVYTKSGIAPKKKEYPYARVFFLKIYYGSALSNTKELWNLHEQGDGEIDSLHLY